MKKMIFAAAMIATGAMSTAPLAQAAATINGAGATFPYPVYSQWAHDYNKETGVKLNYQSIGSGGGIKQIKAKTVDFGASDAPLKAADLDKFGLMQFPMIMGGVVPVVHIKGIKAGQLKLSASNLADIYLGKITKWNDARITANNKGLKLPAQDITVVHRSDGSGTTAIFADYMTKNIMTVNRDTEALSAIQQLLSHKVTCAPVLDDVGKLVGMFSEKDCMKVVLGATYNLGMSGKVEDFMSTEILSVNANSSIVDLADKFKDSSVRSYPVFDDNKLVGIVSRTDVLRALVSIK